MSIFGYDRHPEEGDRLEKRIRGRTGLEESGIGRGCIQITRLAWKALGAGDMLDFNGTGSDAADMLEPNAHDSPLLV